MKKLLLLLIVACTFTMRASADEGMWLLPLLQKMNIKDMKAKGFKLTAKDLFDVNQSSLKDAIIIFGGGCTGEIVSPDGLIFTNHHCGYGSIQALSSVEHDYLKYGFWAMNHKEELPAPGLSVRFVRQIEDVTDAILAGVNDNMTEAERAVAIEANVKSMQTSSTLRYPGMEVSIRPFFGGNQFFLFAIEEYKDVRLVGTPPSDIGKFGGETDNWMWPRHTGDFSVFRVYSDKDGKPAAYSADNVPYKAPKHLKISLKGYKEGDFAMIMGFPGRTDRFMTSYGIDEMLESQNPNRIFIRGERQDVLKKEMAASDAIRIKYASKYAGSSNYWKNSIGKSRGLKKLNVKGQKEEIERRFKDWANASPDRAKYRRALPLIKEGVEGRIRYNAINQIIVETMFQGTELLSASTLESAISQNMLATPEGKQTVMTSAEGFYDDYDESVDRKVAKVMFRILLDSIPNALPESLDHTLRTTFNGDLGQFVDYIYDNSVFSNWEKFQAYVLAGDFSNIANDPAVILRNHILQIRTEAVAKAAPYNQKFVEGHRLLIAGLMEMEPNKMHYPDANSTIRLTYGNVLSYSPADAVKFHYYTTLTGVMEKEDPTNPEFTVQAKLKELYRTKNFGQYAHNGNVPVAFITNNDITGGNSGSPVMNGSGELIGIAFDGNWEAMSGDVAFEPDLQRCINVDVRYVLFIIDKFAGAGYLLNEMTIVK